MHLCHIQFCQLELECLRYLDCQICIYKRSLDYFDTSALLNPFTHTWSLAVEEQFYILYPFITWFTGFCQKKNKANDYLLRLLILLSTLSLLLYIYLSFEPTFSLFFITHKILGNSYRMFDFYFFKEEI